MDSFQERKHKNFQVKIILTEDSLMQSDLSFFFEIRSESLNKSAMSCCSFAGIYCCVYANVMNSAECSSSSVATMVQRAKLAYIIKKY